MTKLIMLGAAGLIMAGLVGYSQFAVQPASSTEGCSASNVAAMMSDAGCAGGSCCSSSEAANMVASSCCSEGNEVAGACCSEGSEAATLVAGACCSEGECPVGVCPEGVAEKVAASDCCGACAPGCGCCDEDDCICPACECDGACKASEAADATVVAEVE